MSKAGIGTLILTGNNSYAGGTTITGGFINFNSANSFGSGLITINGGGLQWATGNSADISAQLAAFGAGGATFDTNGNNVTLAASLSGLGGLTKTGAGTMTLSGVNSYQGGTAINGGTLAVTADANLGAASGGLAFGGGTLQFLAGFITNRAVTLNAGGGTFDTNGNNATLAGAIGGAGGLTKVGVGTMTLLGRQHLYRQHDGQCRHAAGRSSECLRSGQRLYDRERRHARPRELQPDHRLARRRRRRDLGRGHTHHRQRQHQHDLLGAISGTGGLTKIGTGTLLLTGTSNYTGATTVNAGTLSVNGSIASSALTVNAGGTIGGNGDDRQHHHQWRHALARQLDRHPHRAGQPGADVGLRLPRRGLAHGCRPHQRHRHREPRRHRAGGVRAGELLRAQPTPSSRPRADSAAPVQ